MFAFLKKQPWYLFLLPVFFVMHGYNENFGVIPLEDLLLLALMYVSAISLIFGLLYLLFRDIFKASIITVFIFAFYLFFGAIQDFFKLIFPFFSKYSVLIFIFFSFFVALLIWLKKRSGRQVRLMFFLNGLLLIYIFIEVGKTLLYAGTGKSPQLQVSASKLPPPCDSCTKPDIYFLLFDEYASSKSLKKNYRYDNSQMDSFLKKNGFHVFPESKSNYNFTPFSVASILNMNYIANVDSAEVTIQDYARCNDLIKNNLVIKYLAANGYEINNLSVFDLLNEPTQAISTFLPYKTSLITAQTLFNRIRKDLMWMLLTGPFQQKWLTDKYLFINRDVNGNFENRLLEQAAKPGNRPRFFYTHFYYPHPPFYYDATGNLKPAAIIKKEGDSLDTRAYLDYLSYANTRVQPMIATLIKSTNGKAVIVVMGDHGFRKPVAGTSKENYFQNMNAVYIPGSNISSWPDKLSGVNEFRFIFNKLFHTNVPLLEDSSIFLRDKK